MSLVDLMSVMNILPEEKPSRPDYAEKRLAMAMIRDVIGELEDIAAGAEYHQKTKKQKIMADTVAWIRGETECSLTFVTVCEILGWRAEYVGPQLLKMAAGIKPTVKKLHQERGVMARRIGPMVTKRKPAKADNLDGLGTTSQVWERENA